MSAKSLKLTFIVFGSPEDISGGHIYNRKIFECFAPDLKWELVYVSDKEELIRSVNQASGEVLVDAWGLHEVELHEIRRPFHLLAHHPLELDQTIIGDTKKEEAFWSKAESIITTSEFVKGFIHSRCETPSVSVLPGINPISRTEDYHPLPKAIVGFGSLIERKGDILLLEALSSARPVKIKRYGASPDRKFLNLVQKKSQKLSEGTFSIQGLVSEEEKEKIIASADLAVFPTHYESFGMAIQECLESKVPVLVNDFVGAKERFGQMGVRYISADSKSWVKALNIYCHQEEDYLMLVREIKLRKNKFGDWKQQSQLLSDHFRNYVANRSS